MDARLMGKSSSEWTLLSRRMTESKSIDISSNIGIQPSQSTFPNDTVTGKSPEDPTLFRLALQPTARFRVADRLRLRNYLCSAPSFSQRRMLLLALSRETAC